MSRKRPEVEPPCEHWDEQIGTVTAGDLYSGPCSSVATCQSCVTRSQGFVQMRTGMQAGELLTYVEARRQRTERAK